MNSEFNFQSLDSLGASFQKARIILSAAELDIFSKFRQGSRTVEQLCKANNWHPRGLRILLDALTAMGFVKKDADVYSVDPPVLKLLDSESPDTILPMLLHRVRMWNSWSNLTSIVSGKLDVESLVKVKRSNEDMKAFIGAMEVTGRQRANEIARETNLEGRKSLLDIGGGSGVYSRAFLELNPELSATIFDLPMVIEMARKRFEDSELTNRVSLVEGDFNSSILPEGHDIALLSAIIHMNGRQKNRSLFSKIHGVLEPGGILIIRDYIMDDSRTHPEGGAIFAVNMLVATREGNTYTLKEIYEDLEIAGFDRVRLIREGLRMDQLVIGMK
ncbi:MAG: methyltransferase [Desulfomonile sp.]